MTRLIFRSRQRLMDPSRFARCGPQLHEGQGFFGGVIKPPSASDYPLMKLCLQEGIIERRSRKKMPRPRMAPA